MKKTSTKSLLIDIFLLVMACFLTFAITTRFIRFYTLPHFQKVLLFIYILIVFELILFRFAREFFQSFMSTQKYALFAAAIALIITSSFFILVNYKMVPIRTTHALHIINQSETAQVAILEIQLPGNEKVDLLETFSENSFSDNLLILNPKASVSYSREMTGGLTVKTQAVEQPAKVLVEWNGEQSEFFFETKGEIIDVVLDGSSWGSPSIVYRALGILGIINDAVSIFLVCFTLVAIVLRLIFAADNEVDQNFKISFLNPLFCSLWINLLIIILIIVYVMCFNERIYILNLAYLLGTILIIRELFLSYRQLIKYIVMVIFLVGVFVNIYFYFRPPHDLHQTIKYRQWNSIEFFASRIGGNNSTYLSIGYYQYLREANLIITESLYETLMLDSGRLGRLNQLEDFTINEYNHELDSSQVDMLLSLGEWKVWPNRTDGTYYLLPEVSKQGDTYLFFSSGLKYFILPSEFIKDFGVIDVSVFD